MAEKCLDMFLPFHGSVATRNPVSSSTPSRVAGCGGSTDANVACSCLDCSSSTCCHTACSTGSQYMILHCNYGDDRPMAPPANSSSLVHMQKPMHLHRRPQPLSSDPKCLIPYLPSFRSWLIWLCAQQAALRTLDFR